MRGQLSGFAAIKLAYTLTPLIAILISANPLIPTVGQRTILRTSAVEALRQDITSPVTGRTASLSYSDLCIQQGRFIGAQLTQLCPLLSRLIVSYTTLINQSSRTDPSIPDTTRLLAAHLSNIMDILTASDTSAPINSIECSFSLQACARAPQVVKYLSRSKPDGTNFVVWKTQLALVVYIFTNSSSLTIRSSAHDPKIYGGSSELNSKSFQKVQPIVCTEQTKRKVLHLKADRPEDTIKFDCSPTGTGQSCFLELSLEIIERIIQRLHCKPNDERPSPCPYQGDLSTRADEELF
ncbi:hypothetical protein CROQUDRAFT_90768 [Cronartium quercuum f. sp. fusiforme G11]|uniref:Uncharacterized protein n=1 Tax=Cronartium quercuum f. sp. fusiforme G11 TaxID=708437 RepID=A0A9P6NR43_9BASI|nr:hypothetical protein CROQUDRAFT_90768 [Cronartium quercuum f. sp. fusiforme G11]